MTRYVLIDDEQQLHVREGDYRPELGLGSVDRVVLHPGSGMAAFVDDMGFRLPDPRPRNLLGALIAVRLGAAFAPLAGPVVFTGWNPAGCGSEVRNLATQQIQTLTDLHTDYTAALAGTYTGPAWWADSLLADAAALQAADTPTVTIVGL